MLRFPSDIIASTCCKTSI